MIEIYIRSGTCFAPAILRRKNFTMATFALNSSCSTSLCQSENEGFMLRDVTLETAPEALASPASSFEATHLISALMFHVTQFPLRRKCKKLFYRDFSTPKLKLFSTEVWKGKLKKVESH